jgi:hypothetical protein
MVVKTNPEFGIELALTIPYAYWLHVNNQLDRVVTSKGMSPFYYFCNNVSEGFSERTIDNAAAGLNELPNNWIHGIDPQLRPGVLDYSKWIVPPYKDFYKNSEFKFDKPIVFITNKFNLEHGETPYGYFDIQCLYDMFSVLSQKGYKIIYKRAKLTNSEFAIDQNEMNSVYMGYHDIQANVEGIGIINDYQLTEYFDDVILFDELVKSSNYSFNETQLRVMANCDKFITVCGGNSILSSLFGGIVITYVHKGKELRPNYFSNDGYFRKLSGANVLPAYDVIGHINKETYHYNVNTTGKNDYTEVFRLIDLHF